MVELQQLHIEALNPVVQIDRNCSGTLFHSAKNGDEVETFILTAKHCVDDKPKAIYTIWVPTYVNNQIVSEVAYRATVRAQDYQSDLAILQLMDKQTTFTNIAAIAPKLVPLLEGEDVWVVGYSRGEVRTITEGLFGSRQHINFPDASVPTEYFRATPQIAGGNSGGALYHKNASGNYELIGVTSAVIPASDFMGYYVPIDKVRAFVERIVPKYPKS